MALIDSLEGGDDRVIAEAWRARVLAKTDDLHGDAHSWPKDEDGIHFRILSKRFNRTVHYDLVGTLVTVIAIASQRRQPGYSSGRGMQKCGESDA